MKYTLIEAGKTGYPVAKQCAWLSVSRAGYYAWRKRSPSAHAKQDERLGVLVSEAHERSRRTYGSPRVHAELLAQGETVSRKRIVRLMQKQRLVARPRRRYKGTTNSAHSHPVAPNLLARDFTAAGPNQRWVGDTTELLVGDKRTKLYLAVILDLFSRFVVGWALSLQNDRYLTMKALDMALLRRCPGTGLMHHSDRGSTYASQDYQQQLGSHGITCSMSRSGNCLDNAAMESWNSTLKSELGEHFPNQTQAQAQLFDYIEIFYNQQRRHSSLGYSSPAQYERAAKRESAAGSRNRPANTALQTEPGTRKALFVGTAGQPPAPTNALFPETALAQRDFFSKRRYTTQHELALQP